MSNEKKTATLGMPHGTASNRLRKNILFHLLEKHGENNCFKCSKLISKSEDLSIEHKRPWEGVSADLFWDIENIAFSHIGCNRPHQNGGGGYNRKEAPEGMSWCSAHQVFEPVENFWKDGSRWNGFTGYCKKTKHYYRQTVIGRNRQTLSA